MDPDLTCDYNFIMGDLNYRLNSTYEEMIDLDLIKEAPQKINLLDQLSISIRGGLMPTTLANGELITRFNSPKYPLYYEHKIHFFPTYKRNQNDNAYTNKKN